MASEKDKMLAGALYDAGDAQLCAERRAARALCHQLNTMHPDDLERRQQLVAAIVGRAASINPPFFCDYGYNIRLGEDVYFNVNCVILDVVSVTIGNHVLLGPGVHIYTAAHPLAAAERRAGREFGRPVVVHDDVWIGGGAILCPGVSIGAGAVIGAGSVVTRAIPAGVLAAGNPCRVIRALAPADANGRA